MILAVDQPHELSVSIDHGQFLVIDRDSQIDDTAYTPEAQAAGLVTWDGGVAVLCDSHWTTHTAVTMSLSETEPEIQLDRFDQVVIGGVDCTSGELRIFAPEETGIHERPVMLPPGKYGLMVCAEQFGTADEYGDNGQDRYALTLWPSQAIPDRRMVKGGGA